VTPIHAHKKAAVVRLSVNEFRCYSNLRLEIEPRPVVLTGPNGAGKTNILEALSFLAPGRGLRRCKLSEVARHGAALPGWAVAAKVLKDAAIVEIGTGRDGESERRLVRIDGKPARSQASLGEVVSVLWLVPAMDRLFTDSAGGRRRFLDRLVLGLDNGHAARAGAYEHALRERSRLLREGRREKTWLDALESAMARHGVAVAEARRDAVARLNQACGEGIGPFPAAALAMVGEIDQRVGAGGAEDWLRERLAASRQSEEVGFGPHRSDLVVTHRPKDLPAHLCSTGEQKALLLSILLAQARLQRELRGLPPILLLDEVAAHLDATRRRALWDELEAMGLQSWMTGTDRELFAGLGERGQFFDVAEGHVTKYVQQGTSQ
jgi:DNA replication and repair protein RecF